MKKLTLSFTIILLSLFSSKAQTIHCDSFAVLNITIDTVGSNTLSVTIVNNSSGQVNYPSVMVVNAAGDTVANKLQYYYFFAQLSHDTVVHTIPTTLDSLPCNANYTIYYKDNSSGDTCHFTYWLSCTASINELAAAENQFNIFPNPASNLLNIEFPNTYFNDGKPSQIKIINVLGESIFKSTISNQQSTIDISNLPKGFYFVIAEKNNRILKKKLIIQ
jgi:hypothetical protein